MINYTLKREELVETLKRKKISDERVLSTLRKIKRHHFVPNNLRALAYEDKPLSIGDGQTISQPYMVAWMTALLDVQEDHRVLEIGTGSGYQAVILAELAQKVFTVERLSSLAELAKKRFEQMGYTNIIQRVGDGTLGWKDFAPYDRIMVTAGAPHLPKKLLDQLAEGGKLVIPTGKRSVQDLKLVVKIDGKPMITGEGGCVFVPLIGSDGWE